MEKEKEIKELKDRLNLIETFYGENSLIKRIKFYIKYIKEKRKNADNRNNGKNDTSRNNTVRNNSTSNTWDNEINNLFNNEKIKEEK